MDIPQPISTVISRGSGFKLYHNVLPPMETACLVTKAPAVGLVVSRTRVPWTWNENGREHTVELHPGAISAASAGPFPSHFWKEPLEGLDVVFDREFLARIAEDGFNGKGFEFSFVPYSVDPAIEHLIRALEQESKAGHPNGAIFGDCVAAALAMAVIQRFSSSNPNACTYTKALNESALKRVMEFIDAHLSEDLALDRIAGVAHISCYHFNKLFKISVGQSVHQYVKSERIKRARWLLRNRTSSLKEIAFACGFASQSHFTTAFRQETGVTPNAFRLRK